MDYSTSPSACVDPVRVAIAVVVDRGRILISRRPYGSHLAGYWEFPGGKVHGDESAAQGVVREVWEECGLRVRVIGAWPEIGHQYRDRRVLLLPLLCVPVAGRPWARQVAALKWLSAVGLKRVRFPPANRPLIRWLSTGRGPRPRAIVSTGHGPSRPPGINIDRKPFISI